MSEEFLTYFFKLAELPGRPTILITVGQGPTTLVVGAGGGCLDIFTLIYSFSSLSPSLWGTARYRLKYCLKGPLNQKQPTNQSLSSTGEIRPLQLLSRLLPSHFILFSMYNLRFNLLYNSSLTVIMSF